MAACSIGLMGAAPAGTLRIALSTPPGPLDPAIAPSPEQLAPIMGAYEHLIDSHGQPCLAQSWRHDANGRVWTFRIAPGHRFDDAAVVDAPAVKFSLDRVMKLGRGPASDLLDTVERVDAPDAATLRIVLKAPTPRLLSILSSPAAYIVNPAVARHAVGNDLGAAWLATRSAGSGPYRLADGGGTGTYVLERNPYWSGAAPWFSRVLYRVVADPTVRAISVSRGESDVAFLMPSQTLKRLSNDAGVRIVSTPVFAFQSLAFNLQRPVFRDVRLRQAVAEAIDTKGIVEDIRGGRALRFAGPLAPGMSGADPSLYSIRYDPAAAADLARTSGLKPGTRVTLIYPGVSPETDTVAQYIQAVAAPLGLRVRLERLSIPAYLDRVQRGAYDLVLMSYVCNYADPSSILNFWFDPAKAGVSNPARYNNPQVTRLIARSAVEVDPVRRANLNRDIIQRVNADLPYVYLQQTKVTTVVRRDISGFSSDPVHAIDLPLLQMRRVQ
jgi:peptide/nickel transport system substrate-binding protein